MPTVNSGTIGPDWEPVKVGTRTGRRPWAVARRRGDGSVEFHRGAVDYRTKHFLGRGQIVTFATKDMAWVRAGALRSGNRSNP